MSSSDMPEGSTGSAAMHDAIESLRSKVGEHAVDACAQALLRDGPLSESYIALLSALHGFTDEQRGDVSIPAVRLLDEHFDALLSHIARNYPKLTRREGARAMVLSATAARSRAGLT